MAQLKTEEIQLVIQDPAPPRGRNPNFQGYNPHKVPADLELAKKHGRAKKVYVSKHEDKYDEKGREACVCCGLPVEGENIPLNSSLAKLYHLGSGFALYFRFIKYAIGLLMLVFLVEGIYNIASNLIQADCSDEVVTGDEYCVKGYILSFTIPNKRDNHDLLTTQLAVNLATIVLIMLFFHYIRFRFRKTAIDADDRTITPSDYTIVIEDIPAEATKDEIEKWIQDFATEEMPLKIERIIRPNDINEYIKLVNRQSALFKSKTSLKRKNNTYTAKEELKSKTIDTQLQEVHEKIRMFRKNGLKKCSLVYVTFAKADQCSYVQSKFKRPLLAEIFGYFLSKVVNTSTQFQGNRVKVERAPEPSDIMWENLGYTKEKQRTSRYTTTIITVILIALSFGLIILVNWGQNEAIDNLGEDSILVQILSVVASLVIVATNTILAMTIDFLARYEKHFTYTYYLKGVAEKLAVAQFFNTALTNLFAELILANPHEGQSRLEAINFYGKGGLLENMYWVFITNAFMTPALIIFDPNYIMKRVMQYLKEKKGFFSKLTQQELNRLYEGPNLTMPSKFAGMIKMVLITTFYAPALPFVIIFSIAGLVMWYWSEKYVLLRRNSLPNSIDDGLAESMVELLEWSACTFAVGNIIYAMTLKNSNGDFAFGQSENAMIWVGLGISLFHIFFPMDLVNKKLFSIKDEVTETLSYEEARIEFNTDYDIENPLSKKRALKAHLARLKKEGNDDQRLAFFKNLGNLGTIDEKELQGSGGIGIFKQITRTTTINGEDQIDFDGLDSYAKQLEVQGSKLDQNINANANLNPILKEDNVLQFGKLFETFIPDAHDAPEASDNPQKETAFVFPGLNDKSLEDNEVKGLFFSGLNNESPEDNKAKGVVFPGLTVEKTPSEGFGRSIRMNDHPPLSPKNPSLGPLSPDNSSVKSNNSQLVNADDKELENFAVNLFNMGSVQDRGVTEKKDLESKARSESAHTYFGGERKEEKK